MWAVDLLYWKCPLCYKGFSVSWGPIYQLFILEPEPLVFCSGLCLLYQCNQGYFPPSLPWDLVHPVSYWVSWCTWTLVLCMISMDLFLFLYMERHPVSPAPFEGAFSFLLHGFVFCIKYQLSIDVWVYFLVFHSIPLINVSVYAPIPSSFYYYYSVVLSDIRDCDFSQCSIMVQDSFGYPRFFVFTYQAENWSFKIFKKIEVEFWWGLHWICSLLFIKWPVSLG